VSNRCAARRAPIRSCALTRPAAATRARLEQRRRRRASVMPTIRVGLWCDGPALDRRRCKNRGGVGFHPSVSYAAPAWRVGNPSCACCPPWIVVSLWAPGGFPQVCSGGGKRLPLRLLLRDVGQGLPTLRFLVRRTMSCRPSGRVSSAWLAQRRCRPRPAAVWTVCGAIDTLSLEESTSIRLGPSPSGYSRMTQEQSKTRGLDKCPYFHRTAVIMADGEVVSCANFFAENVGYLGPETPLSTVWNGQRMRDLRGDFGTEFEWTQCRNCWFREIGYYRQRKEWHERSVVSIDQPTRYSEDAWDFTNFIKK